MGINAYSKIFVGLLISLFITSIGEPTFAQDEIPTVNIDGQTKYLMGDLLVDIEDMGEVSLQGTRPVRVQTWEDGILPIVFEKDVTQNTKALIWSACQEWSQAAKVKCVPGPYKKRQLTVSNHYIGGIGGCWSMLGQELYFLWIKRRMNIGEGCEWYPTVLHELGHAFGLGHEHQRPDRDQYITIFKENIKSSFLGMNTLVNFSTQEGETLGAYDFLSIMHYSKTSFSKNGKNTMYPKPEYEKYGEKIGRSSHLSELDKVAIQKLYGVR